MAGGDVFVDANVMDSYGAFRAGPLEMEIRFGNFNRTTPERQSMGSAPRTRILRWK